MTSEHGGGKPGGRAPRRRHGGFGGSEGPDGQAAEPHSPHGSHGPHGSHSRRAHDRDPYADAWDEDLPKLRPYVVTGGRTRPTRRLDLASLVKAGRPARAALDAEHAQAVDLCQEGPRSVAELAGKLHQPAQITKVLLSDLLDTGALVLAVPKTKPDPKDPRLLEQIIAGLREL